LHIWETPSSPATAANKKAQGDELTADCRKNQKTNECCDVFIHGNGSIYMVSVPQSQQKQQNDMSSSYSMDNNHPSQPLALSIIS
jgi:hypothetical protein